MHSHQNCIIQKETMYYLGYIVPSSHIDAFVTTSPQIAWRLTGLYGHPDDQCKHETWSLLRHLKNRATLPWVCMGDSNEILSSNEKNGRLPKPLGLMQNFRNALLNCGLVDLGYNGRIFTWRNWQGGRCICGGKIRLGLCNSGVERAISNGETKPSMCFLF